MGLSAILQRYCLRGAADSLSAVELASWRCIVVDDIRIRADLLLSVPESSATQARSMIRDGVIDVRGMPVLDVAKGLSPCSRVDLLHA